MIADFLASWPLFGDSYLAAWLLAALLSLAGVWVVARDQIFLGAAVSQASTLGTALALWLQGSVLRFGHSDALTAPLAVAASVATVFATARPQRPGGESPEAVTGWIYLAGASLPMLILARHPHGLEEVHRLLFSSILGASRFDVWIFGALLLLSALGVALWRERIALYAMDPQMAAAVGMSPRVWSWGSALWLGAAVGLAIHAAGMLYTFGCLVLPALFARNACREVRPMFWVAPAVALAGAGVGFVLAHALDVPPAQLTVGILVALVAASWALRRRRS